MKDERQDGREAGQVGGHELQKKAPTFGLGFVGFGVAVTAKESHGLCVYNIA
jgi:hypothetical protein